MAETNGNGNGTPAWLKAAVQLGTPAVIAIYLVYWITTVVSPKLDAHTEADQAIRGMITAHVDSSGRVNAEILFYLRSLCINAAKNQTERERCVPPREP